jgi:Holliday junction resolvase RusA-like endonuclease
MALHIVVTGTPAPQGSKSYKGMAGGHAILAESSKKVKPWRQDVKLFALEAIQAAGGGVSGPVDVEIIFTLAKPKSAPKRIRTWPDRKPDLDKLCRSTFDALCESGAIDDDARIVHLVASKVFPGEGNFSMTVPGAVIRIEAAK